MNDMYTSRQAANVIGCTRQNVFEYSKKGRLTVEYVNDRAYFHKSEVDAFPKVHHRQHKSTEQATSQPSTIESLAHLIPIIGQQYNQISSNAMANMTQSLCALFQTAPENVQSMYDALMNNPAIKQEIEQKMRSSFDEWQEKGFTPNALADAATNVIGGSEEDLKALTPVMRRAYNRVVPVEAKNPSK